MTGQMYDAMSLKIAALQAKFDDLLAYNDSKLDEIATLKAERDKLRSELDYTHTERDTLMSYLKDREAERDQLRAAFTEVLKITEQWGDMAWHKEARRALEGK